MQKKQLKSLKRSTSKIWKMSEGRKEKKKEIEQENLGLREWTEEDNNEMGNICDPYYEL